MIAGAVGSLGATEVAPTTGMDLEPAGRIQPRAAREIAKSPWFSIGAETIDRGFIVYENCREHVGPLGAKHMRLQAGWARCEPAPGEYAWGWLESVVDHALAQGVRPWLQVSYGNPIYPGGGEARLGGGVPTSPEALAAWDNWVRALATRFDGRVHEWEIWNEPDLRKGSVAVDDYTNLFVRTAGTIRAVQPQAKIWALGLSYSTEYADQFLSRLAAQGRLGLVDAITIHGYPRNPDDTTNIDELRAVIAKYDGRIEARQGETGAPSRFLERSALRDIAWTENLQAKWNLRRLLAHRARNVPCSLFSFSDMHYRDADGSVRINHKGILATNPDQTIAYAKPAYAAAQNVFSLFDDTVSPVEEFAFTSTALRKVTLTGYRRQPGGDNLVAYWFGDAPPGEASGADLIALKLPHARYVDPVLVDLRTGVVYSIPRDRWSQGADGAAFHDLPAYDAPLLIAERAALPLVAPAN